MTPEEAENFYEEDEPLEDVLRAWRNGQRCWICPLPLTSWPPLRWLLRWHLKRMAAG